MSGSRIGVVKVVSSFFLATAAAALIGGCSSTPSQPANYALTGTNGAPAFVPPASTVDSKGHYHPDWYFHGAPRN